MSRYFCAGIPIGCSAPGCMRPAIGGADAKPGRDRDLGGESVCGKHAVGRRFRHYPRKMRSPGWDA